MTRLTIVLLAVATLGAGKCDPKDLANNEAAAKLLELIEADPGRACPPLMQPLPGVGLAEVLEAAQTGGLEEPLCECREGAELIDPDEWLRGCAPVEAVPGDCLGPEDNEPSEGSPICGGVDPLAWEDCWACTGRSGGKWVYHERAEPPPTPTPTPTAEPTTCPDLGITIDARCAGASPGCGIVNHSKAPQLSASGNYSLWFDASYYCGRPSNKVHGGRDDAGVLYDPRYPGPIEKWVPGVDSNCGSPDCHIDCSAPRDQGHGITCRYFGHAGRFWWDVKGAAGATGRIEVVVR